MSEKEFKIFGVQQRPLKIYHTCTFQDLGSRKDEFLEKIVRVMEREGLKKAPPMEPLKRSRGVKDVFDITDWSFLTDFEKWSIEGCDVLLLGEKKKDMAYPPGIAIRAEAHNGDLRLGYVTMAGSPKLKSRQGLLKNLALATWLIILVTAISLSMVYFYELMPFWELLLLIFAVIFPIWFIPLFFFGYIRPIRRMKREHERIDKIVTEIAESLGGKQITPFKRTTVELED